MPETGLFAADPRKRRVSHVKRWEPSPAENAYCNAYWPRPTALPPGDPFCRDVGHLAGGAI
jgi:hypothetical protein